MFCKTFDSLPSLQPDNCDNLTVFAMGVRGFFALTAGKSVVLTPIAQSQPLIDKKPKPIRTHEISGLGLISIRNSIGQIGIRSFFP